MLYNKKNKRPGILILTLICFFIVMLGGRVFWNVAMETELTVDTLSSSSRMINSIFGAVITAMALIITLASNLYTPSLVRIFVKHPVVVIGLSYIVGTNFVIVLGDLFNKDNEYYMLMLHAEVILSCIAIAGVIPFLYYVSQFLRPNYFLPLIFRVVENSHADILNNYDKEQNYQRIFDSIDTIANISLTAGKRDDRQLMCLASDILHQCLLTIMDSPRDASWRREFYRSKPGHSADVKQFLSANSTWPEAYIFNVYGNILRSVNATQNEMINESCENLLVSLKKALDNGNRLVAEMHIMFFNRLNELAIENGDYERIQSLSQYFIQTTEMLGEEKELLELSFASWFHYARDTYEKDIHFGYETYLYDSGHLLLDYAKKSEESSCRIFNSWIKGFWNNSIEDAGKHEAVTNKVAVKTYWQAKTLGFNILAQLIEENYLTNEAHHKLILKEILKYKSPMHWSFADRLLRFNHLPTAARKNATKFLEDVEIAS